MEKNQTLPEKTPSTGRRGLISPELDDPDSPADPSPAKSSPSRHKKRRSHHSKKKNAPKDPETASFQDKAESSGEPEFQPPNIVCNFGKIFEDVDNFIDTLWPPHLDADEIEETQSPERDETENQNKEDVPECVKKFLDLVEGIVMGRCDSSDDGCKWNDVPEGDMLLLESVDRISKMVTIFSKSKPSFPKLFDRVGRIQHTAMAFLEEQLRSLLEDSKSPSSGSAHVEPDPKEKDQSEEPEPAPQPQRYPEFENVVVWCIKTIATRMLHAGYEAECCHVYNITRHKALDHHVYKIMGFERVSVEDMQKLTWEVLEKDISTWIKTCEQCATVYFPGESKLIGEIFADHPEIAGDLYRNLIRTVLIHLFNFAEAVAVTKPTTEKLFKVLDMYETMRDTILSTESLFPDENTHDLRREASLTRTRLGETAVAIFCELENSIRSDTVKTTVPGGAVHPLTRYTMNYLNYACQYNETLGHVFREHSKFERADSTSRPRHVAHEPDHYGEATEVGENQTPLSVEVVRVMDLLDANLEAKSKLYKDIALSSIFLMNNGRYILQKIKKSPEIDEQMGDTWSRKRSSNLRNYHKVYQRETWNKVLGCLTHEGLMNGGKVVKPAVKERFKTFNNMFEEVHKTQSAWVVSDEQLQMELRISISSLVIPAYRAFIGRFAQYLDPGRQTEKYIKFQPEAVEACIDDLFEGSSKKK